jgi:hypothetical protein
VDYRVRISPRSRKVRLNLSFRGGLTIVIPKGFAVRRLRRRAAGMPAPLPARLAEEQGFRYDRVTLSGLRRSSQRLCPGEVQGLQLRVTSGLLL